MSGEAGIFVCTQGMRGVTVYPVLYCVTRQLHQGVRAMSETVHCTRLTHGVVCRDHKTQEDEAQRGKSAQQVRQQEEADQQEEEEEEIIVNKMGASPPLAKKIRSNSNSNSNPP